MTRKSVLTIDFSNLRIHLFLSSLRQELSPFYLMEAFSGFSVACPNCQQHSSFALGPSVSKTKLLEHKHCDTGTVTLITKMAIKWLMSRWCIGLRFSGQRDDLHPGWDGVG